MDEVVVTALPHPITTFILGFMILAVTTLWFEYKAGRRETQKFNSELEKISNQLTELKSYVDTSTAQISKKVDSRVDKVIADLKRNNKI
jgi:uncharacterized protein YlxW (UPF0749 family)